MCLKKSPSSYLLLTVIAIICVTCTSNQNDQTFSEEISSKPVDTATPTQLPSPTYTITTPPTLSATPALFLTPNQGQILFSVYPYGDIGLINADGSGQITLLDESINQDIYNDRFATWLPDGSGISYTIDNYSQAEIWVIDTDGNNPRMIIKEAATFSSHAWAPDANLLAYVSRTHKIMIYYMGDNTSLPLTDGSFDSEGEPDWSPDGKWICFVAIKEGNKDIYIIHPDGTGLKRVTTHPGNDQHPDWAPDSNKIAFSSTRDGDNVKDIFTIDIRYGTEDEGNISQQITFSELLEIDPDWSPDGEMIVYSAHEFGGTHATLFIMDASGENYIQLTERNIYNSPKWHP